MCTYRTKIISVDINVDKQTSYPQLNEAALWIKQDEVVAFPTETVYGLGANALSESAVNKIFKAKGRPSDNPLIVHISNKKQLENLVTSIPAVGYKLMDKFWPGPLTLVLEKGRDVASGVTAGLSTVAIRMPDHPVAQSLIEKAGVPVAAPSANTSGKPSPTEASHVMEDLHGRIAAIVDGGKAGVGVESTVLDLTVTPPMILRPGGVTKEEIEKVIGKVQLDQALENEGQAPKSPGLKYKHYAPNAKFVLVSGSDTFIQELIDSKTQQGERVGVLTTDESLNHYSAAVKISCGQRQDISSVARNLYRALREFNEHELDIIYSEVFPYEGVGEAVMNRLKKAANGNIIRQQPTT